MKSTKDIPKKVKNKKKSVSSKQKSTDDVKDTPTTPKKNPSKNRIYVHITPSGKKSIGELNKSDISTCGNSNSSEFLNLFESEKRVKKAYKIIQKSTGALGGNGYNGAIYGELTLHSMQKVIDFLVDNCELGQGSMFIDVGSGLGKPNFHASQDPAVRVSIGIELEEIRWQLAMQNLKFILKDTQDGVISSFSNDNKENISLNSGVNFIHGDIFDAVSTDPFTHVYMYDLGFPPSLQRKIAEYFNASTHAKYLVSYRPPRRVIDEYDYNVKAIGKIPTSMTGSGEVHTAYFYQRTNSPAPCQPREGTTIIHVPGIDGLQTGTDFVCSNYFKECVELALGPVSQLADHVNVISNKILNSGRPKRTRKTRNLSL